MVFSSFTFLFLFLPITLLINYVLPKKFSNVFLLIVSLLFYYYGEKGLTILLLLSICWNFVFALIIEKQLGKPKNYAYPFLVLCVVGNLSLLFYYKYLLFFLELMGLNSLLETHFSNGIVMPIGISFFTFHGLSYVVDVYRKHTSASKNIIDLGLYLAYFPQLIAGPIIKYHDIHTELKNRVILLTEVYSGINRFIRGLAKKIILANNFAFIADEIMNTPTMELSSISAWVGILCYTLQIYYDFAGYSDMAIGLARMMGFHFKENFNYPYIATSIQDFWRRWHISLSTWFKEYVYIPLGGNQRKNGRVLFNLLIVFILTGLWHGASINFLIWGLIHGFFIILERILKLNISKAFPFVRHVYTLLIVVFAWVFFRIETFEASCVYLRKLLAFEDGSNYFLTLITPYILFLFVVGFLFVLPVKTYFKKLSGHYENTTLYGIGVSIFHLLLLLFSLMELSFLSYNPFIYFRF